MFAKGHRVPFSSTSTGAAARLRQMTENHQDLGALHAMLTDIALPSKRPVEPRLVLPSDTVVVSADGHWLEGDIWMDFFPAHLRDRAPRMRFEQGGWQLYWGPAGDAASAEAAVLCDAFECMGGMTNVSARLADLDAHGVAKELLFPQRLFALLINGELESREWIFDAYNHHLAGICAQAPDRLYFAAVPNYWDPAAACTSIRKAAALGASAFLLPVQPRSDAAGVPIQWADAKMAPLWLALEDAGLPVCFHIGENLRFTGPGSIANTIFTQMQGFRATLGALVFGGVFDRHPRLSVVFVEGGISWVASALYDADLLFHSYRSVQQPKLAHPPSWYWTKHCFATFITDPLGLTLLDRIGADRVMWSLDYPHYESSLGYSQQALRSVFDATPLSDARKIVGGTALDLFRMSADRAAHGS